MKLLLLLPLLFVTPQQQSPGPSCQWNDPANNHCDSENTQIPIPLPLTCEEYHGLPQPGCWYEFDADCLNEAYDKYDEAIAATKRIDGYKPSKGDEKMAESYSEQIRDMKQRYNANN